LPSIFRTSDNHERVQEGVAKYSSHRGTILREKIRQEKPNT
jgi:hypothetical protein